MDGFGTINFVDMLATLGVAFLFGKMIFGYNKNPDKELTSDVQDSSKFYNAWDEYASNYASKYVERQTQIIEENNDCPYCHCAHQNGAKCENCGAPLGI
jgi:methionyl-tRNA synthetase